MATARKRRRDRLLPRLALLLSLALLPIGVIAVIQTTRAIQAAEATYLSSLRAQTVRVVTPDREAIITTFGVARALADAVAVLDPASPACTALMQRTMQTSNRLSYAGFTDTGIITRCNNTGQTFDFSDDPGLQAMFADPTAGVNFTPRGEISGEAVVIVREPVVDAEGAFRGMITLSFATADLTQTRADQAIPDDVVIVTFNADGAILTSDMARDQVEGFLPADMPLAVLATQGGSQFSGLSQARELRNYAVVPIVPGRAFALGSWPPAQSDTAIWRLAVGTVAFPTLMWLISILVALFSIHRLVIRPVSGLGRRMRSFADGRRILNRDAMHGAPGELRDIGETFELMATKILHDEADLENRIHERDVLLKEVHHRVKNNLQLMTSIMNMQTRRARTDAERTILRSVQDRLRSLATVHRGLYEAPELSVVRADTLLADLVAPLTAIGAAHGDTDITLDLAPVTLVPDQAAPLAMLTAEAVTNALKYVGGNASGDTFIRVALHRDGPDDLVLEVVNSTAPGHVVDGEGGLGQQLIRAFVQQLGGTVDQGLADGAYHFRLRFGMVAFAPE